MGSGARARGRAAVFGALFARPFGSRAVSACVGQIRLEPPRAKAADERLGVRVVASTAALLGATAIGRAIFLESPVDRLTTIWRREPGLLELKPTVTPTPGGAIVGASGRF